MIRSGYLRAIALHESPPQDSYLSDLAVVRHLQQTECLPFKAPVTFLVGENGTGKSTLLEAIAVALGFNPEGGGRNFNFSTNDSHSELWKYLDTYKGVSPRDGYFLRAESVYNLASYIDELDETPAAAPPIIDGYGGVSLHKQSHGESFLALVQNRFGGNGLYILDEPEAALSPMRQLTLLSEIERLVRKDSQLIISTHSPILMAYPDAQILQLSDAGIQEVAYTQTEHYQVTRRFLEDPKRFMHYLLENE